MIIAVRLRNGMSVYEVSDNYEKKLEIGEHKRGSTTQLAVKEIVEKGRKLCDIDLYVEDITKEAK